MKRCMAIVAAGLLLMSLSACDAGDAPVSSGGENSSTTGSAAPATQAFTTAPAEPTAAQPTGTKTPVITTATTAGTKAPTTPTTSREVKVTIKEHWTLAKTFLSLEKAGVASFDDLLKAAQTYDFTSDYPLVAAIPDDPNRCYRLEGYLFPNTYYFFKGGKPEDAIGQMLRGSKAKFTAAMQQKAKALGFTFNQIVVMASLIEKEGPSPEEAPKISAVIHNRLKKNKKLELDVTVNYLEGAVNGFIIDKNAEPSKWNALCDANNTYKCAGLPVTPICNPGTASVNAALKPANITSLYFCSNAKTGEYFYADTYEEHEENLLKAGVSDKNDFTE